ncbi:unnamed protein product [Cuscuta europaea]|uniref:Uncharacterized protein n=1 Tax=Cuscuta europaea TaxID=41803 RepID=A0A9P0Z1Y5_CUSEU|nr:unnamed protein product [Cuscuta europaea]
MPKKKSNKKKRTPVPVKSSARLKAKAQTMDLEDEASDSTHLSDDSKASNGVVNPPSIDAQSSSPNSDEVKEGYKEYSNEVISIPNSPLDDNTVLVNALNIGDVEINAMSKGGVSDSTIVINASKEGIDNASNAASKDDINIPKEGNVATINAITTVRTTPPQMIWEARVWWLTNLMRALKAHLPNKHPN